MTKADKMFEELGYKKIVDDKYLIVYNYYGIEIVFNNRLKEVIIETVFKNRLKEVIIDGVTVREHLAIHEKMKELGWI